MNYKNWAESTMTRILKKLEKTTPVIGARFPHVTNGGEFDEKPPHWWTNGFWPGILWLAYSQTDNKKYAEIANEIEGKMDVVLDEFDLVDHDAGFIWMLSSGANYMINGDKKSRCRLLKAASFLASRFNLKGNFIRAWNTQKGWAIIDCTMNLPLLYRASKELDDPRFKYIAHSHIKTVLKYFVREDGSVNHIVSFNPENGEYIDSVSGQGAAKDSAWARGASWALYGLALAYRHLQQKEILDGCKKVANFFIANLPEDYVAHWDFRVKRDADTPRDTSAAACAACGLLELAEHVDGQEGDNYREKAYRILRSLTDNYSNLDNEKDQALLRGGTGNMPAGIDVGVGLIYGDYFYMEGISRLMGNKNIFWYSKEK